MIMKKKSVSVLIATKNEGKNIARCLRSLKRQSYQKKYIEIILIDNGSSDRTVEYAKKMVDKIYDISKYIKQNPILNFRGAQVNYGFEKSGGEIIFFPDADMTFSETLLEEAVFKINQNKFDALYIPETIVGKGLLGKVRNFERSFYNQTSIDGLRIIKRDIFEKVGGFDIKKIQFGFDDWDLTKRIKSVTNKISITSSSIYHHEEKINLITYLTKKSNYTGASNGYINKWGINDKDVKKQFGIAYRYFYVFTENEKWKKLLRHPLMACYLYILKFLVGLGYLVNLKK